MSLRYAEVDIVSCGVSIDKVTISIEEIPCPNCKDDMGVYFQYVWLSGNDKMRCINCGQMIQALPKLHLYNRRLDRSSLIGRIDEITRMITLTCPLCSDLLHRSGFDGYISKSDGIFRHKIGNNNYEVCPASDLQVRLASFKTELEIANLATPPSQRRRQRKGYMIY